MVMVIKVIKCTINDGVTNEKSDKKITFCPNFHWKFGYLGQNH